MSRLLITTYLLGKTDDGNAVMRLPVDVPFTPRSGDVLLLPGPLDEDGEPQMMEYPLDKPTYNTFFDFFEDRQNESSARELFLEGDVEGAIGESQRLLKLYQDFGFEDSTPTVLPLETDGVLPEVDA
jgi:hypothetical protein